MDKYKLLIFIAFIVFGALSTSAQTADNSEAKLCLQDKTEKLQLIKEAEENQFKFRRIVISGNEFTRHRTFRERMPFKEGDFFTQNMLYETIKNFSRIKAINPINIDDVKIELDRQTKDIDITFCVIEKRKN